LPLNGRNYADLALLAPGVRKSDLAYGIPPRDASFNVNGMRSSQNNFMIDGVDNIFTAHRIRDSRQSLSDPAGSVSGSYSWPLNTGRARRERTR